MHDVQHDTSRWLRNPESDSCRRICSNRNNHLPTVTERNAPKRNAGSGLIHRRLAQNKQSEPERSANIANRPNVVECTFLPVLAQSNPHAVSHARRHADKGTPLCRRIKRHAPPPAPSSDFEPRRVPGIFGSVATADAANCSPNYIPSPENVFHTARGLAVLSSASLRLNFSSPQVITDGAQNVRNLHFRDNSLQRRYDCAA
ncbi:unnamed protein product, partial [Iphiclides podalirius]